MQNKNLRKKYILAASVLLLIFPLTINPLTKLSTNFLDYDSTSITEAQLYVDPERSAAAVNSTFVIDVFVNVADPDPVNSPPDGLWGFEYKLNWDDSVLNVVSIQYHVPPGWTSPFEVVNMTSDTSGNGYADLHWLALTTLAGTAFTGVTSLCTYTFQVTGLGGCALDIYDDKLVDDTATLIPHTTDDGYFSTSGYPVAIFTYLPLGPLVGEVVTFNASASYDSDGTIVSYFWDFGDGTFGTGMIVTHTYTAASTYNVTLTVTDNDARIDISLETVTVIARPQIEQWAVIIGINEYNTEDNLAGPVPDANDIYKLLSDTFDFPSDHIHLLTDEVDDPNDDVNADAILDELDWLDSVEDSDDIVVFYFSGHGSRVGDEPEYIVAHPGYISDDDLNNKINELESQRIIVILDTCHSGGFAYDNEVASDLASSGRIILTACKEYQNSTEEYFLTALSWRGVFTFFLTEGFRGAGDTNDDGFVTVEEAFSHAKNKTINDWIHGQGEDQIPQIYDGILGNLYLKSAYSWNNSYNISLYGEDSFSWSNSVNEYEADYYEFDLANIDEIALSFDGDWLTNFHVYYALDPDFNVYSASGYQLLDELLELNGLQDGSIELDTNNENEKLILVISRASDLLGDGTYSFTITTTAWELSGRPTNKLQTQILVLGDERSFDFVRAFMDMILPTDMVEITKTSLIRLVGDFEEAIHRLNEIDSPHRTQAILIVIGINDLHVFSSNGYIDCLLTKARDAGIKLLFIDPTEYVYPQDFFHLYMRLVDPQQDLRLVLADHNDKPREVYPIIITEEVTVLWPFVSSKDPSVEMVLISPDGVIVNRDYPGLIFLKQEPYKEAIILHPKPGIWRLEVRSEPNPVKTQDSSYTVLVGMSIVNVKIVTVTENTVYYIRPRAPLS